MRVIYLKKQNNQNDMTLYPEIWNIFKENRDYMMSLYDQNNYISLFLEIKSYLVGSSIVKNILLISNKWMSPIEFIDNITSDSNPYNWANHFNQLIK